MRSRSRRAQPPRRRPPPPRGFVYLVGAGPGDPGLLTVRAADVLARADVVVYDRLVHPRILDRARPDARRIFAGKRPRYIHRPGFRHGMAQEAINEILLREARRGQVVVRLKGGDPFVFGRGGEEALALAGAGIPFEIVPGVTAAVAAPEYAGIPITHRRASSAYVLVSGHEDPAKPALSVDGRVLASFPGTIEIYLGFNTLGAIAELMVRGGMPPDRPVAVIERGTWPSQRTITGTLATIATRCRRERIVPPSLVVIGDVVRLRDSIAWFEQRPLAGRRVVVTRAHPRAAAGGVDPFVEGLAAAGAEVLEFPTIRLATPRSWAPVDRAIRALRGTHPPCAWIAFLSANAVERFLDRVRRRGGDARTLGGCRLAAIGAATARALAANNLRADLVAEDATSEGLARVLPRQVRPGDRVLLPRTDIGRDVLPAALRRRGARVEEVCVYRTVPPERRLVAPLRKDLLRGEVDVLTFASAQAVRNFVAAVGRDAVRRMRRTVRIASIGPITSGACRAAGLRVHAQARTPSLEGLVQAVVRLRPVRPR